ncbi:hypothetical protein, partial [Pseudomonas aeruginosa]
VIDRGTAELSELQVQLLKSIAVIELVGQSLHVLASPEVLNFVLLKSESDLQIVTAALADLEHKTILLNRQATGDYAFTVSQTVNIEALYRETLKRTEDELMFKGIAQSLSETSVIASRHYQQTGTLRSVRVIAGTPEEIKKSIDDYRQHDGCIGLMFVDASIP